MTDHAPLRRASGFTLIELMIAVAIVGLLASTAIPQFQRAALRSRVAERATVMTAVGRAVQGVIENQQALPTKPAAVWSGLANPPGVPGAFKRRFDFGLLGWQWLPMVVEGDAYYSYSFVALDPGSNGQTAEASVLAIGDLDGDGFFATKQVNFSAKAYAFQKTGEIPPAGQEDDLSYGTF